MSGFTISMSGLQSTLNKLKEQANDIAKEVDMEIAAGVEQMATSAKRMAPKDVGFLSKSISADRISFLQYELVAQSEYAAYMEFGTKSKVSIPSGLQDYAKNFQGKGKGNLKDMERNLTAWVKRKGLSGTYSVKTKKRTGNKARRADEDKQVARAIMFHILKFGVKPHPFFFPSVFAYRQQIVKNIVRVLREKR